VYSDPYRKVNDHVYLWSIAMYLLQTVLHSVCNVPVHMGLVALILSCY